jgi:hypothetical protein
MGSDSGRICKIFTGGSDHHTGKKEKADEIGPGHKSVENI